MRLTCLTTYLAFYLSQLSHCLHFAKAFPDHQIVYALRTQLSWTHLRSLIYIEDPLKRDFYIEICQVEGWSSRQLRERLNSMLCERIALSRKPEETIRRDLAKLRKDQKVAPELLLKDPYLLDFLDLSDRYLEKDLEDTILAPQRTPTGQTSQGNYLCSSPVERVSKAGLEIPHRTKAGNSSGNARAIRFCLTTPLMGGTSSP